MKKIGNLFWSSQNFFKSSSTKYIYFNYASSTFWSFSPISLNIYLFYFKCEKMEERARLIWKETNVCQSIYVVVFLWTRFFCRIILLMLLKNTWVINVKGQLFITPITSEHQIAPDLTLSSLIWHETWFYEKSGKWNGKQRLS